jgi:UDP-N-acetyl-2-amino-2-deoxyglucuronate dehydrogenase
MKKWKVAVIGCGSFANGQYLPNVAKEANAEVVAAVDIIYERAERACRNFGIANAYSDVYELLEKCDFDIAIDSASIQAHHEINIAVLNAGKHLISQKPASPTIEGLTEQILLAEKKGVKFACAPIHPMRYDLNFAKQLINSGAIGRAYYAKCNMSHGGPEYFQYRDADPSWFYEPGAGALVDMGVHGLQIVTSLFGAAESVACTAAITTPERKVRSGRYDGTKIKSDLLPDHYIITLRFPDNRIALVDSGFSQKASRAPQLEIFGDEGTISFTKPYMTNPKPEVYIDCPERGMRGWITPEEWTNPPRKLNSQCCILKDLIDSIEKEKTPLLSAYHARHVLEIMCRIPEAIESGSTVKLETSF